MSDDKKIDPIIDKKISKWKDKLLDLSKRNHMLNFRPRKASSLKVDEDFYRFPNFFIEDEKSLVFEFPDDEYDEDDEEEVKKRKKLLDEHRFLKNISKKIKIADEEFGYNVGYIAYGFLEWSEIEYSDIILKSPLILIPIQIYQEDRFSPYYVQYKNSEDIQVNPTIIEKLHSDFGIDFGIDPKIDLTNPDNIRKIIEIFRDKISENSGWKITEELWIDTFDFQNMVILNDLKLNSGMLLENSFSKSLLEDNYAIEQDYEENIDLDKIKSKDNLNILDADSSQEEAIYRARKGESFVIQGPPGTGKSQTIANIIAEALYHGKSVLFVSEKQAALDVVYEKLRRADLSVFCLKMHNSRQTKNDIRAQLQASINLSDDKMRVADEEMLVYDRLDDAKIKLNAYNQRIHEAIEPIGKSAFWIFGKYQKVSDAPELHEDVPLLSLSETDEMFAVLGDYVAIFKDNAGEYIDNGWNKYTGEKTENAIKLNLNNAKEISSEIEKYYKLKEDISRFIEETNLGWPDFLGEAMKLVGVLEKHSEYNLLDSSWSCIGTSQLKEFTTFLREIKNNAKQYNKNLEALKTTEKKQEEVKKKILSGYKNSIIKDINKLLPLLKDYNELYSSPLRFLNSEYRKSSKVISSYAKNDNYARGYSDTLSILQLLKKYSNLCNSIKKLEATTKQCFDNYQNSISKSDIKINSLLNYIKVNKKIEVNEKSIEIETIEKLEKTLGYYAKLLAASSKYRIKKNVVEDVLNNGKSSSFYKTISDEEKLTEKINELISNNSFEFAENKISKVERIEKWQESFSNFDWSSTQDFERYCIVKEKILHRYEIGPIIDEIEKLHIDKKEILPAIKKQLYLKLLEKAELKIQYLSDYSRNIHDKIIDDFRIYDEKQRALAKQRIRCELIKNIPDFYGFSSVAKNGQSEIALIKREIAKKSRLMPTRKLIERLPILLPKLKPCIMMSPITVSSYFSSNPDRKFDLVIFDEASQVKTETAVTSIMRAKQLIVAGDSKQMPPTNFFNVSSDDDLDDDDEDLETFGGLESVLDELSIKLPQVYLKWHYRSKDESLIEFSNRSFYEKRLYTFPSVYTNNDYVGVSYHYVENGEWSNRNGNIPEAEEVAKIVFGFIKECPDKSIGVVAFGRNHANAIEDAIYKMRDMNPQYEDYFTDDKDEPFFVKNLENVQGDERDIIILSTGYGKDSSGKFAMRFGPLAIAGGERRLNVAISRSKEKMVVVSSFHANEIHIDNANQTNRKLLRDFIYFAENGKSEIVVGDELDDDVVSFDSPFEEEVYNFITSKGYKVKTQVGVSGYKIDMAIIDANDESRYLLAIECDGASYHSSRTARDRDKLRQTILEGMGWKFHRIWSTDWFYDEEKEKDKLIQAIEKAILGETVSIEEEMMSKGEKKVKVVRDSTEKDISKKMGELRAKYATYVNNGNSWYSSYYSSGYYDCYSSYGWEEAFKVALEGNIDGMTKEDFSRFVAKEFLMREKLTAKIKTPCFREINKLIKSGELIEINGSLAKAKK